MSVDFYGPICEPDRDYFFDGLSKFEFVSYKGELQPEQINSTIEKYDAMLLPTHYYTEGLPGSVVDAYMSGIPIVVSKWKHAEEFVIDGKTGFIIPFENGVDRLEEVVTYLYDNTKELSEMKKNAYKESFKYSSDSAWKIIVGFLD